MFYVLYVHTTSTHKPFKFIFPLEMFAVYQKIISPASSPVLGPASPNLVPMTHANNATVNNATNATNATMESLSLCNYCCSPRIKIKKDPTQVPTQDPTQVPTQNPTQVPTQDTTQDPTQDTTQDPMQCPIKSKYEFGHATHYVYRVTTPRLLCDFE
jgi:hypothetical protein